MSIDKIISTIHEQKTRDYIRRKYQSELQVLGEREALEFARFRADAAADILAEETTRIIAAQRKKIIVLMAAIVYIGPLVFALGIILGLVL